MFQKLPIDGSKWKKDVSKFNEEFIKDYKIKIGIKNIFLK